LIGLMAALLGSGFAQTLVLTNGDVNGDNGVDDADLLSVLFAMGQCRKKQILYECLKEEAWYHTTLIGGRFLYQSPSQSSQKYG